MHPADRPENNDCSVYDCGEQAVEVERDTSNGIPLLYYSCKKHGGDRQ